MSVRAINWALEQVAPSTAAKFVLLILANFANEEHISYPKQETIARLAQMTVRTVRTAVQALENPDAPLIKTVSRHTQYGRQSDVYLLGVDGFEEEVNSQPENFAGRLRERAASSARGKFFPLRNRQSTTSQPEKFSGSYKEPSKEPIKRRTQARAAPKKGAAPPEALKLPNAPEWWAQLAARLAKIDEPTFRAYWAQCRPIERDGKRCLIAGSRIAYERLLRLEVRGVVILPPERDAK